MTEQEWLTCTDPRPMLAFLRGKVSDRKMHLFKAVCCRRIWPLLTDERSRRAVEATERLAEGLASREEIEHAARQASLVYDEAVAGERIQAPPFSLVFPPPDPTRIAAAQAAAFALCTAHPVRGTDLFAYTAAVSEHAADAAGHAAPSQSAERRQRAEEMKAQTVLLRELVGNPYRPGSIDRSRLAWRGRTIPDLARAIYDDCEDERFAILADALEEAGCGSPELVAHCRGREFCGKCHGTGFRDLGRRIPCTRCEGWGWRNVSIEHIRGCWVLDLLLGKV